MKAAASSKESTILKLQRVAKLVRNGVGGHGRGPEVDIGVPWAPILARRGFCALRRPLGAAHAVAGADEVGGNQLRKVPDAGAHLVRFRRGLSEIDGCHGGVIVCRKRSRSILSRSRRRVLAQAGSRATRLARSCNSVKIFSPAASAAVKRWRSAGR